MKPKLSLILLTLLLAACTAAPTADRWTTTATPSPRPAATTPLPTITSSSTEAPSHTPIPPTATLSPTRTPLPTRTQTLIPTDTPVPSATPTFDAASVVTRTPAPPAVCPEEKPELAPDFDFDWDPERRLATQILDFLNAGGVRQSVIVAYRQHFTWADEGIIQERDVTFDGVPELLFTDNGSFVAYVCKDGQYQEKRLLEATYHFSQLEIVDIVDMNLNGVDEVIAIEGDDRVRVVSVLEWDGSEFKQLNSDSPPFTPPCSALYGTSWAYAIDTDGNGTLELVLKQDIPILSEYSMFLPWRKEERTCMWDGGAFVLTHVELSPPEYRFQAVQDGDRASLAGEYDKALELYQQAIFSDKLDWWTFERRVHEIGVYGQEFVIKPTPIPSLLPDPLEYPNLAAYARFRILLLHLLRGYLPEAQTVYATLQEKFPAGQPGHAYAELAAAFWDEYQASQSMGLACGKAIEYATAHPVEILAYLGNSDYSETYFGQQSLDYQPEDVCPFDQ